jgi:single-strand DNA-binding protein
MAVVLTALTPFFCYCYLLFFFNGGNAMASVNKAILIGNLGKDPDFRMTPAGQPVANFSIATTERWNDKSGQRQERTEWHNIVLWGRLAEIANQFLKKGSSVYVEGRLQTRSWEDKDGNRRYTTEVVGTALQMLGRRGGGEGALPAEAGAENAGESAPAESRVDDDLPF